MNQLREICRVINIIDDETKKLEKARAGADIDEIEKKVKNTKTSLFDYFVPQTKDIIKEYEKRYKCTNYQARSAFKDAAASKEKYISTFDKLANPKPGKYFAKYAEVTPEGRKLNSTVLKVPTGRYNAWLKDNSSITKVIFGSGLTALVVVVGMVINAIYSE